MEIVGIAVNELFQALEKFIIAGGAQFCGDVGEFEYAGGIFKKMIYFTDGNAFFFFFGTHSSPPAETGKC